MSGIFGIWWLDGRPIDPRVGEEMSRRLRHRGPDGASGWDGESLTLGHRMLRATPEAARESQPLTSADGQVVLTADVRLDNREALIAALSGSVREDCTDADLLLATYRSWGERCVERWVGDFAVAIWDAPARRLFCARDPFGVKPLYYHHTPGRLFAFASDVEAVLAVPEVPGEISDFEVARHLRVPLGRNPSTTYYEYVRRVPPAHALSVSERGCETRRYWDLDPARELRLADDDAYAEALRESFVEAVRCRLRSDKPVAAMLSGGVDSSAIACVAADLLERAGRGPLHALSAVYPSVPESDESEFIQEVLRRHRMMPHFFSADAANPVADIDRVNRLIGGASWGANLYLNWVLYGVAAAAGAGVVLDGFDGDTTLSHGTGYLPELARGGHWWKLARTSIPYSRRQERPALSDLMHLVRMGLRHPSRETLVTSFARRFRRAGGNGVAPPVDRTNPLGLLNPEFARRFADRVVAEPNPPVTERESHRQKLNGLALFEGIGWLEACAAGRGIEVRLPFCDVRLVELCFSLPPEQKLRRGWTRYAMRQAMEGILPPAIQWRRSKTMLSAGQTKAWRSTEDGRIASLLERPTPAIERYLDPGRVLELHARFMEGKASHDEGRALWRALSLALWLSGRTA